MKTENNQEASLIEIEKEGIFVGLKGNQVRNTEAILAAAFASIFCFVIMIVKYIRLENSQNNILFSNDATNDFGKMLKV